MLELTNLLNFFCWVTVFNDKILLLLLRNNELTWAKSIKLISCCNEEWLELNSFFKTLRSDFLWRIFSCNNFNWHCLYVKEALRDWLLTRKFKKLGITLLSLHRNKNRKSSNEYLVKDSFTFAEEIVEHDSEFLMGNLDVDSLFTNIPLEETINICTNTLFENTEKVEGLSKIEFKELLSLATKESLILFLTESSTNKSVESLWVQL